jgi:hypothetical protein
MRSSTLVISLLLCVSLWTAVSCQIDCPPYNIVVYDKNTKIARCEPCPDNCADCGMIDGSIKCQSCKAESYKDLNGACKPCATGCEICFGPEVDKCLVVKTPFSYDPKAKILKRCTDGCSACDEKGRCIRCELSYIQEDLLDENGLKMTVNNHDLVKCVGCTDKHCQYCEKDNFGSKAQICNGCEAGYGIDPKTKTCQPCSEGCLTCMLDSNMCSFCKDGYEKVAGYSTCKPISIPNCLNQNFEEKKCLWCKTGFTPNHQTDSGDCITCSVADPLCTNCRVKSVKEKYMNITNKQNLVCTGCPTGYVLNSTSNECLSCGDNCNYCDERLSCYSCNIGYSIVNNTCTKSSLPNCEQPNSNGKGCSSCYQGHHLEESSGKCLKCHDSCLLCDGPGEDDCTSCSVNKFSIKSPASVIFGLFGIDKQQCVDRCPDKLNGENCVEDSLVGECVVMTEAEQRPKSKYPFRRTEKDNINWSSLYHDSHQFLKDYNKYVEHNFKSAREWAGLNYKDSRKYARQCNYRGLLTEKMSASRGAYYHCHCMTGTHGANCEVDKELYKSIQLFIAQFIKDIVRHENSIDEKLLFKTVTNIAQVTLSIVSLNKLTQEFTNMIAKSKRFKIKFVTEFLIALDRLMRAFYDEKTELEERVDDYRQDIGYENFMSQMYQQLHHLINMGDDVVRTSIHHFEASNIDSMTQAFQVTEYKPHNLTFRGKDEIYLLPTNIRGTSDLQGVTQIIITNKFLHEIHTNIKILAWAYSRLLFPKDLHYASHLVQVYPVAVMPHESKILTPSNIVGDSVEITFPLKVTATEIFSETELDCTYVKFDIGDKYHIAHHNKDSVLKRVVQDEGGIQYAVCMFNTTKAGYFYTVTYKHETDGVMHAAYNEALLSHATAYTLEKDMPEVDKKSNVAVCLAALLIALMAVIN